jgi:quinolinate synthase
MLYRLSKDCPGKRYYPVSELSLCPNMKLTTLDKVLAALQNEGPVVTVDADTRQKALQAVQRMIEVGA